MHKPNCRARETRALAYWREIDAILRRHGDAASIRETDTLFLCGYSVAQAIRALAPNLRPELVR